MTDPPSSDSQSGYLKSICPSITSCAIKSFGRLASGFVKRPYNRTTVAWRDAPVQVGNAAFLKLDVETTKASGPLKDERVYYQAQLQLCVYYSLVQKPNSPAGFDEIDSFARNSECWPSSATNIDDVKTIGEYAILKLAVDAVMIAYLVPHVPKSVDFPNVLEMVSDDCQLLRTLELVHIQAIQHTCALMEAYLELLGGRSRAMMSLPEAKFLLTRSLNLQTSKCPDTMNHASPLPAPRTSSSASSSPTPPPSLVGGTVDQDEYETAPILWEPLGLATGDNEEFTDVLAIKSKHLAQRKRWMLQLETYLNYGHDIDLGEDIEVLLRQLRKALDPEKLHMEKPYARTHKRAYKLALNDMKLVRLVVRSLFGGDDALYLKWKSVVSNVNANFKYFDGKAMRRAGQEG